MARRKVEAKRETAAEAAVESAAAAQRAVELKAEELVERLRDSEAIVKAQAKGAELAERLRDTHLDERAAAAAERALQAVRDAHLDERAAAVAARLRDSEKAQRAAEAARRRTDEALEGFGAWIQQSKAGERMGLSAQPERRRFPWLIVLAIGGAIGYVVSKLTSQTAEPAPPSDLFVESADRLATAPPGSAAGTGFATSEAPTPPSSLGGITGTTGSAVLTEEVRTSLDTDPRTAGLHDLSINVAESTVFVRGSVPPGFDEGAIREVVAAVPGVTDVDLQVTPA